MKQQGPLSGWGRYPQPQSLKKGFANTRELRNIICSSSNVIARGNGRSYGDSSLGKNVVPICEALNHFIAFEETTGLLTCESGVLISEIIEIFFPKGWFLEVTPGTKYVSIGGAIASDIHGKNHHKVGCFSQSVKSMKIMLADGEIVECSKNYNSTLFHASCGGMGLTGIILEVSFYLKSVKSNYISQKLVKTINLKETLQAFDTYSNEEYSVAWIDCLATGAAMGRSLLMLGDFLDDQRFDYLPAKPFSLFFDFPSHSLNKYSVSLFNNIYYNLAEEDLIGKCVSMEKFFYPLDCISNWNRIYGRKGFVQYQFVIPKPSSLEGITEILDRIVCSGMSSFLAVLKLFGPENKNYLSFPIEGFTLALDFAVDKKLWEFLDSLDEIVLRHKGRVYLTKDSRICSESIPKMYRKFVCFQSARKNWRADEKFCSYQSARLGL